MARFITENLTQVKETLILPSFPKKLQIFVNNNPMFALTLA